MFCVQYGETVFVDVLTTGTQQVVFVDGEGIRLAVDLPGAGKDDFDFRIVLAARLEDGDLGAAVNLEIGIRVIHGIHVAGLAGEVEEEILLLDG